MFFTYLRKIKIAFVLMERSHSREVTLEGGRAFVLYLRPKRC